MTTWRLEFDLRRRLQDNLDRFRVEEIADPALRRAAVAIVVAEHGRDVEHPAILLTLRTSRLNRHAGQYALPGGKLDPGETLHQAALRELHAEVAEPVAVPVEVVDRELGVRVVGVDQPCRVDTSPSPRDPD